MLLGSLVKNISNVENNLSSHWFAKGRVENRWPYFFVLHDDLDNIFSESFFLIILVDKMRWIII